MSRYILPGILLTFFSLSSLAAMQMEQTYQQLDTDKNGYISLSEVNGKHRIFYFFSKADKNSDGHIDMQEFINFEKEIPDWESDKYK